MGLFIPLPIRVPSFIKWMHPYWYIWDKPSKEKVIYLTFDDGPIPEITEWVLDLLAQKKMEATFFCIGDNVQKNPTIFNKIIDQGHSIGNQTQNH
jgi:peptidoglycan/xylan/chitin deacetylase (PgdA/CDA1 family)